MSDDKTIVGIIERHFKSLGYAQPGQGLNVATAKGLAAEIAVTVEANTREAVQKSACPKCQDKFKRQGGGVF